MKLWKRKCLTPGCGREWLPRKEQGPKVCHWCQRPYTGAWVEVEIEEVEQGE